MEAEAKRIWPEEFPPNSIWAWFQVCESLALLLPEDDPGRIKSLAMSRQVRIHAEVMLESVAKALAPDKAMGKSQLWGNPSDLIIKTLAFDEEAGIEVTGPWDAATKYKQVAAALQELMDCVELTDDPLSRTNVAYEKAKQALELANY